MSLPMIGRTAPRERAAVSGRGSVPVSVTGASCAPRDPGPRRLRGEEGLAAFVVCIPAFFLAVLLAVQFALWSHASHLARAAAEGTREVVLLTNDAASFFEARGFVRIERLSEPSTAFLCAHGDRAQQGRRTGFTPEALRCH